MVLKDKLDIDLSDGNRQGEQAVIICLQIPVGKLQKQKVRDAIFDFGDILCSVVGHAGVGRYDGLELCEEPEEESVKFFVYGSDANRMYDEIKPILQSLPLLQEVSIVKQYAALKQYDEHSQLS